MFHQFILSFDSEGIQYGLIVVAIYAQQFG